MLTGSFSKNVIFSGIFLVCLFLLFEIESSYGQSEPISQISDFDEAVISTHSDTQGTILFEGTISTRNGDPVSPVEVLVIPYSPDRRVVTNSQGQFSIQIEPGIYSIDINSLGGPHPNLPNYFGVVQADTINISEDMVLDFTLPNITLDLTVLDSNGKPVNGASITATGYGFNSNEVNPDLEFRYRFWEEGITGGLGKTTLDLFPSNEIEFFITPPNEIKTIRLDGFSIFGNMETTLVLESYNVEDNSDAFLEEYIENVEKASINNFSGDNAWNTRPTFGESHELNGFQIVENGFSFDGEYFTITDNHHTDFEKELIAVGTVNKFSAKVYADKKLKIQEFLFGIPEVGHSHLAELGVEVWFDTEGNVDDIRVVQKSNVIDANSLVVNHSKTKCLQSDIEPKCDLTTVSLMFLEPLKDQIMAIKAIDFKNRSQRTYLNDGFEITGNSLNPMPTKMIPSSIKNEGLVKIHQVEKYSHYWKSVDGRLFEMNDFGSFKQINKEFERFKDSGEAKTRAHSEFSKNLAIEEKRAKEIFDSTKIISSIPDSFGYHIEIKERITEELKETMHKQAELAKKILEESQVQARW